MHEVEEDCFDQEEKEEQKHLCQQISFERTAKPAQRGKHNGMKQGLEMSKSTQASCGRTSYIYMSQTEKTFPGEETPVEKACEKLVRAWQDTQA